MPYCNQEMVAEIHTLLATKDVQIFTRCLYLPPEYAEPPQADAHMATCGKHHAVAIRLPRT